MRIYLILWETFNRLRVVVQRREEPQILPCYMHAQRVSHVSITNERASRERGCLRRSLRLAPRTSHLAR